MRSFYEPLRGPHAFRLLDLLPGSGDQPICCKLTTSNLALRPEYFALSYTWGSDDSPVRIDVNGLPILIQNNLHNFLLRLRLEDRPRTIWVDSICINQKDNADKSVSIPLMKEIYTVAQSVLVWLGSHEDGSAELFKFFYGIIAAGEMQDEKLETEVTSPLEHELPGVVLDTAQSQVLDRLLHRPYWERTWILQEIVLARNIRIFCGDSTIPWADFAPIVRRLQTSSGTGTPNPSPFARVYELRQKGGSLTVEQATLMKYGSTEYPLKCKDRRDLVYGVLGLIGVADKPNLAVDYTCSMEELAVSTMVCYRGGDRFEYFQKLTARLQVTQTDCFAYAKKVVEGETPGDVKWLLDLNACGIRLSWPERIDHIDGNPVDMGAAPVDGIEITKSSWSNRIGPYKHYEFTERRVNRAGVVRNVGCFWTKFELCLGDHCSRGYIASRGSDGEFAWFLFKRPLRKAAAEDKLIYFGFGIRCGFRSEACRANRIAVNVEMKAYFNDDYPYFEGDPDRQLQLETGKKGYGRDTFISILDFLKVASFGEIGHDLILDEHM